ncbi:chromate transporter [Cetobacterium sp. 2G large]|uniref:chromate transporter n=1 Tax=Cetobacterium sp. 2G large TaxID=2759680 RepID=UPI00163CF386|nr:chromate transporter [Cetobacterium sp. 2G large]MBC2853879.1 chromate transporter [Cetobacterium sp. 2G large]
MIYFTLFYEFFKIGLFSFGGGLAMLPLMQDVVFRQNWLTEQQFLDIIAISQVTPGPIAINTATFVGHQVAGIPGAFVATFSSALPSFIVILIVASIFYKIKDNPKKDLFFRGVKPVTLALISFAGIIIAKPTFFVSDYSQGIKAIFIFLIVFLGTKYISKINPIIILLLTSLLGIFIF